jgi:prepilin-type N-terminal cleavage/methylation domain-containing protein
MKNFKKGFTLIELLVVVAIIGILAAVVLASLNTARNKGNDAAVKLNLKNAIDQGEIFWITNTASANSYTNVCTNGVIGGVSGVGAQVLAAAKASNLTSYATDPASPGGTLTTATCNDSSGAWAAEVPLKSAGANQMWCVDSSGKSKQESATIGTNTNCN